jgi:hypothetical protein
MLLARIGKSIGKAQPFRGRTSPGVDELLLPLVATEFHCDDSSMWG